MDKKFEKTQKQLNELKEDFNKCLNKTKITEKEINEIKKTAQDMREKFNKDMESLRQNNQTESLEIRSSLSQIKNTVESHSSRLEQVEDRISGLEDKIYIKAKTEEY
jgi:chromosome segregation ATPase